MIQQTPNTPNLANLDYPKATKALIKIMDQKMSAYAEPAHTVTTRFHYLRRITTTLPPECRSAAANLDVQVCFRSRRTHALIFEVASYLVSTIFVRCFSPSR